MIRPTTRAVFLFVAGVPITLVALLFDASLWALGPVYILIALLFLGLDGVLALPPRALSLEVRAPGALFIGSTDPVTIRLETAARHPLSPMDIVLDVEGPLHQPEAIQGVWDADRRAEVSFSLAAERRGTGVLRRIWLRWRGPFGLMWRGRVHPLDSEIAIVPNVRAVRTAAVQFMANDAFFGSKVQRQQGDGSEFEALRDYAPGMDPRSIDWKHSARHRSLLSKEFQTERNHQIVLAFDTGQLMSAPMGAIPKLDHGVNAALLLAYASLKSDDRVGVFGFDSRVRLFNRPLGGVGALPRIQRAMADLAYCPDETNYTLGLTDLLGRLDRRTLVILITDFVDTVTAELMVENLQRLSRRHLVLFVTLKNPDLQTIVDAPPASLQAMARTGIADTMIRERQVVMERLRRLGVLCLETERQALGAELVNRYLAIKRRELI